MPRAGARGADASFAGAEALKHARYEVNLQRWCSLASEASIKFRRRFIECAHARPSCKARAAASHVSSPSPPAMSIMLWCNLLQV